MIKQLIKPAARQLSTSQILARSSKVNLFDLNFDRRIKVDHLDSIKYLESEAYKRTYAGKLVWQTYRRNHKNQFASVNTRPNCINKEGFVSTSYPCPICRDEYLVLHPENVKLLEQFIDPYTGDIISTRHSGLCLKQFRNLQISIIQAYDLGTLTHQVPDRWYNYDEYYLKQ